MKRFYAILAVSFALYASGMSWYLLKGDLFSIQESYRGTAADPHTFMSSAQIEQAESLSRIHSLTYFLVSPLRMALLLVLLGASATFRNAVEAWFRRALWRMPVFVLLFLLVTYLLFLPVDVLLLKVDRHYGISNETPMMFLSDLSKDFVMEWLATVVMLWIFYFIMKRSPRRWWLWFWLASIPLILFVQFLQPVVLEPLYNDFQPLQNEELKQSILSLTVKADIPTDQVYEVNMSERTSTINAYVSGIGNHARIVIWDTTLKRLKTDEILTVMAHEMGHYVEKHIYWGLLFSVLLSLGVFWISFHAFHYGILRWGPHWGIRGVEDLAALPLLLLIVTLLNFAVAPLENAFSRVEERRADRYAMEITGDGTAAIRAFQKIAKENLSPVTQPNLVQWFRGSHPTILERVQYFDQFQKDAK